MVTVPITVTTRIRVRFAELADGVAVEGLAAWVCCTTSLVGGLIPFESGHNYFRSTLQSRLRVMDHAPVTT